MGTVFGYRGKLFSYSKEIDGENLLYPDYGGSNGGMVHVLTDDIDIQTVATVVRDDDFRLCGGASIVQLKNVPLKPALLFGINRLKNRDDWRNDQRYQIWCEYRS